MRCPRVFYSTTLLTLFIVAVLLSPAWIHLPEASPYESWSVHLRGCRRLRQHYYHRGSCSHFPHEGRPQPQPQPQPQPPPAASEEIDPRYGVEKRLVPTGPNPLHN